MPDHEEYLGFGDALLFAHDILPIPINVRYCLRCGAIVADEEKHSIFHGQVDSIL